MTTPRTCIVCNRSKPPRTPPQESNIFVCDDCDATAAKLLEIQDTIWPQDADVTDGDDAPR